MAGNNIRIVMFTLLVLVSSVSSNYALLVSANKLSPTFYHKSCPNALFAIRRAVSDAIKIERRMGASLLRLHFHDCFVNGCDGSVLLDQTATIDSEKNALPNANSARGFEVVDRIKAEVDKACGRPVVSCADILAVAARDSVVELGGPSWPVQLGRRDSTNASRTAANNDIPLTFFDLPALISSFKKKGLNVKDLVALSGSHTLGFAQCRLFRSRIYNETNIDQNFARQLRSICPAVNGVGDTNLAPLDPTPAFFDTKYFTNLVNKKGLVHSDQQLFNGSAGAGGGITDSLVKIYASNSFAFSRDFATSMIKMGNIKPLTGKQGQIRLNCRRVNSF